MTLDPVSVLREYAFWLERELADTYRVRAYREAADVAACLAPDEWPSTVEGWRALPKFGPKTAGLVTEAMAGRVPEALARKRTEGEASLDPAGDELRTLLRGDLHTHTLWSDGGSPVAEMAAIAEALGHEYLAITDHSPRLTVARGLSRERLLEQWDEIARVQGERSVRILRGCEVDILTDGSLDRSEDLLAGLEVVVASVHSDLRADSDAMTTRMVRAVSHPATTVLGHCTGRKRRGDGTWRPQSTFDPDLVFAACAMFGVAVEINARPERQDPPLDILRVAVDAGCLFSIDSDAHAPGQLDFLTYGAARAAAAGVEPDRIITTWPVDRLLEHCRRHR